ncbi:transglutaminase-like domain-containing protein [Galbitalea sp. SE-J8]|uniref:transglutaminase-like domain-containing protein n=1 Tax=Galbitalea sp. SE-J8 TaxID=3054952 RepID=UPI00259D11A6|nr:transglutaminase-like domain-containing protein [Galbitalea sp. SE-J8]MDM4763480.1 transglutaminase-like domain-containing protein [Galbitalea sp. SE-J8]
MSRAAVAVTTLFYTLALGLATATFWLVYQDPWFFVVAGAGMLGGVGLALVGRALRWPAPVVAIVALVLFALAGVPLAVPGAAIGGVLPSLDGEVQLFAAVVTSWKQLVTIAPPVGGYQALLVPPLLLAFAGGVVGASTLTRTRIPDAAALVPVAVFTVAIALGVETVRFPRASGLLLLALLLAMIVSRRAFSRRAAVARALAATPGVLRPHAIAGAERRRTVRSAALAVGIVLVASTVGAAAAVVAPAQHARSVVRSVVPQPFDANAYPSPLGAFRSYLRQPTRDATLFTVTGLAPGARIRLATLDAYDGVSYTVGGTGADAAYFSRLPFRIDRSAEPGRASTVSIVVGDYAGRWLPTIGDVETVRFAGPRAAALGDELVIDPETSTAAVPPGVETGDVVTIDSVLPVAPPESAWPSLTPGAAVVPGASVVPEGLEVALAAFTAGATDAGERLAAMVAGLRAGTLSHGEAGQARSAPGHSAARITTLLSSEAMVGDQEQYAVAGALMAGQLGFPARVVVGFAPDVSAGGSTPVTGADVSAWLEVDTAQNGWVPIDVTPTTTEVPATSDDDDDAVARPPTIVRVTPGDVPEETGAADPENTHAASPLDGVLATVLAIVRAASWVLAVLGVVAAPFVSIVVAKARRRRRRRRRGPPSARVAAGWREFEDAVVDHGYGVPQSATRAEFAATLSSSRALVLAAVADRAAFGPDAVDDEEVGRVWRAVDELRAALDRGSGGWGRVRARVSLRSFGRSRRARVARRRGASS